MVAHPIRNPQEWRNFQDRVQEAYKTRSQPVQVFQWLCNKGLFFFLSIGITNDSDYFSVFIFSIYLRYFYLSSNTTKIFEFIDIIFCQYLLSQSICTIFIDGHTNENTLLVKLSLVISGLSMSSSIIKLPMDLLMTKTNTPKFIRFIPSVFHSGNLKDRTQFC
jgi:hypothetical protein